MQKPKGVMVFIPDAERHRALYGESQRTGRSMGNLLLDQAREWLQKLPPWGQARTAEGDDEG